MVTAGWTDRAACRDADPELFFPVSETATAVTYAKAVCALCPVRPACLQHAVGAGEDHGIWGGLSERERRGLAKGHTYRQCSRCHSPFVPRLPQQKRCNTCAKAVDKRGTGPIVNCPSCNQPVGINPKSRRIVRHRISGGDPDRPYCRSQLPTEVHK